MLHGPTALIQSFAGGNQLVCRAALGEMRPPGLRCPLDPAEPPNLRQIPPFVRAYRIFGLIARYETAHTFEIKRSVAVPKSSQAGYEIAQSPLHPCQFKIKHRYSAIRLEEQILDSIVTVNHQARQQRRPQDLVEPLKLL